MSAKYIPGTNLPLNNETSMMFSNIDVLFSAAKGLSLSQVTSISGLPASTIQNWVKRGWIKVTNGKKYEESSFSRILIINILRDTIQLEKIDDLLNFICNKSTESNDDIIEEQDLYHILCTAIIDIDRRINFTPDNVPAYVLKLLGEYKMPSITAKERLQKGLTIMLMAYISSTVKKKVEALIEEII